LICFSVPICTPYWHIRCNDFYVHM
jgi:hypothetical protein